MSKQPKSYWNKINKIVAADLGFKHTVNVAAVEFFLTAGKLVQQIYKSGVYQDIDGKTRTLKISSCCDTVGKDVRDKGGESRGYQWYYNAWKIINQTTAADRDLLVEKGVGVEYAKKLGAMNAEACKKTIQNIRTGKLKTFSVDRKKGGQGQPRDVPPDRRAGSNPDIVGVYVASMDPEDIACGLTCLMTRVPIPLLETAMNLAAKRARKPNWKVER